MATTPLRDRIFAWVGVIVIIISVGALSAAVIIQDIMTRSAQSSDSATQATTQTLDCSDSDAEPTFAAPAAYIVDKPVSDLLVTDVSAGNGAAAKAGDCLVVKYYGTLAKNGTMFDENYTKPQGFAFPLGQGQVIPGWDKGLVGMKVGGERRLVIPAAQAYGSQAAGSIPANSDLVFYVKLLKIKQ